MMTTLRYTVTLKEKTLIVIGRGVIDKIDELIKANAYSGFLLLCDENTRRYSSTIVSRLSNLSLPVFEHVIKSGEDAKQMPTVLDIATRMIKEGLGKKTGIIALGGGVIGDVAAIVSGLYMRGIDCIQIPTTLVSQVDSSLGGKGAVNLSIHKNIVGIIKQPRIVIIDINLLHTLPKDKIAHGMAEIIKYAVILDKRLFKKLESAKSTDDILDEVIKRCIDLKMAIVQKDPKDTTEIRMILNFGHTLAHAIELSAHIAHGEAVAIGMVFATKLSARIKLLKPQDEKRIIDLIRKYHLPVSIQGQSLQEILEIMKKDKKAISGNISFVLTPEIGKTEIKNNIPDSVISQTLLEVLV